MPTKTVLFSPLALRGLTLKNRVVISPMCQYSAHEGVMNDWHYGHLTRFAAGGAGLIIVEATAVERRGRITHGCTGLWDDGQIAPMHRVIDAVHALGGHIGVQLAHAGRKASISRPWEGDCPLSEREIAKGELPWETVGASAVPFDNGWIVPHELSPGEIAGVIGVWTDAARRAVAAGFDMIEIHSAHGYLSHSFLSPLSNHRTDRYGGSRDNRMRFTLELAEAMRAAMPAEMPLFLRLSCVDGKTGGWAIEDSVELCKRLKTLGVDAIDCSSGGIAGYGETNLPPPTPGYNVPFAAQIRRESAIPTQAVGLIREAAQAETILRAGAADLVALAREALRNPFWAHHAAEYLGEDPSYTAWPRQYGHWLGLRARGMFGGRAGDSDTVFAQKLAAQGKTD